jgi:hypothetical protein
MLAYLRDRMHLRSYTRKKCQGNWSFFSQKCSFSIITLLEAFWHYDMFGFSKSTQKTDFFIPIIIYCTVMLEKKFFSTRGHCKHLNWFIVFSEQTVPKGKNNFYIKKSDILGTIKWSRILSSP